LFRKFIQLFFLIHPSCSKRDEKYIIKSTKAMEFAAEGELIYATLNIILSVLVALKPGEVIARSI
jgi:hypothetical protein